MDFCCYVVFLPVFFVVFEGYLKLPLLKLSHARNSSPPLCAMIDGDDLMLLL